MSARRNDLELFLAAASAIVAALSGCAPTPPTDDAGAPGGRLGDPVSTIIASFDVVDSDEDGVPTFITGELGALDLHSEPRSPDVSRLMTSLAPIFHARGEDLALKRVARDDIGDHHLRFAETRGGLHVFGGELVLHERGGVVYAANGRVRGDLPAPAGAVLSAVEALSVAWDDSAALLDVTIGAEPELAYLLTADEIQLVYVVRVDGTARDGTPVNDTCLVNAVDGSIAQRIPHINTARDRELHDLNHGTTLPGPTVRTEGGAPSADPIININYDWLGATYSCYEDLFGWDSFDNAGAKLISSVHYSTGYVNAFWNGTQMVYGDGDGVTASNLATAMDVTAHELTHALTQSTSNLTYSGESGGLNEAMSDILGNVCEWYRDGYVASADTWKVGEDVWTPGVPGDALRYMDDPSKDGASLDYYPDYHAGIDVHHSSGIANLAFYLLAHGGSHPRGKTQVVVTGIGVAKAARLFHRANAYLMTASTTFLGAKTATEQAAFQLGYTTTELSAVTAAWRAVGVGAAVQSPCPHPKCNYGMPLAAGCSPCVASICAVDPYCCDIYWDSFCVAEVRSVCDSMTCGESAGSCGHPLCSYGLPATQGCDPEGCSSTICAVDPYCCDIYWDSFCVAEVSSVCSLTCD